MKKIIFVLSFALVALAVFSYDKAKENDKLALALSGQYAKRMADASEKLDELNVSIEKSLLFNQSDGSKKAREDIWRLTSDIRSSIDSLPLDASVSTAWNNYLSRIGSYAKDADRLSNPGEYEKVMAKASNNLQMMSTDWQVATAGLVDGNYSMNEWVERLDANNSDIKWSQIGNSVKQYTESDFPLTASESDAMQKKDLQNITDAEVSQDEAVSIFKQVFPHVTNDVIGVEKSQPGAPYPFYHIRFASNQTVGYIDITEKGGHVLSYLADRPFGESTVSYDDMKERTEDFLKQAGYRDVVFEEARENANAWHFVYVRVEPLHNAKVFSDVIHVKTAKDTGEIVGLNAAEYIRKEKVEDQPTVKIDWKTFFNKGVNVEKEELAYVENEQLKQRLAYFLTVTKEDERGIGTYQVLVDTETKEVIKTEKLF
ncbi:PepSY1/2 domain-containing protein [Sporosarcina sp. Te-1]|uniref:PepSY1/2 domain-containing protein n=1 Tax=Sporosarcina sp. Te-1 TaxID=2818390 RepID=UPI001A9FF6D8|nr:PepSY1/2 domain-containing protein [Sporosarcina sp. Te-1]QTD42197.1 germination protein YpeB [Sporosarcina sp. Te-1]